MSSENSETGTGNGTEDIKRLLTIGNAVVLVLVLFAMTVSTFLIFALRSDVAALEEQARKSAKATKALQDELTSVKEQLASTKSKAAANSSGAPLSNIDAADPRRDCVVRPGDKNGVSGCLKVEMQH